MGNAFAETATTATGGVAVIGPKALVEAESVTDGAPSGKRPKPANLGSRTKAQRESWKKNTKKMAKGKRR